MTAFLVIAAAMILFFCIFRIDAIMGFVKKIVKILMPFVYGLVIAYLLNPIFSRLHKWIFILLSKLFPKHERRCENISKVLSSLLSVVLLMLAIYALLALIIPELYGSLLNFANNLSTNLNGAEKWLRNILDEYPEAEETILSYYDTASDMATSWVSEKLLPSAGTMFSAVTTGLGSMMTFLYNMLVGIIVAVYLLNGKDVLLAQCRKLIASIFRADYADAILKEFTYANQMFSGFVYGKVIDSLLIGMIYFIVGTILNIPYVSMISVIVGVTNMIPFFGPYIGAVPSAIILLLTDPMSCLKFVIAIVVIQQFDGNFLGPKILGNTTGLSSYWVLFSIILFGGLFGFVGMIIGVPLFAVIYHIVKSRAEYVLSKKGLSTETDSYIKQPEEKKKETKFFGNIKSKEKQEDEQDK